MIKSATTVIDLEVLNRIADFCALPLRGPDGAGSALGSIHLEHAGGLLYIEASNGVAAALTHLEVAHRGDPFDLLLNPADIKATAAAFAARAKDRDTTPDLIRVELTPDPDHGLLASLPEDSDLFNTAAGAEPDDEATYLIRYHTSAEFPDIRGLYQVMAAKRCLGKPIVLAPDHIAAVAKSAGPAAIGLEFTAHGPTNATTITMQPGTEPWRALIQPQRSLLGDD